MCWGVVFWGFCLFPPSPQNHAILVQVKKNPQGICTGKTGGPQQGTAAPWSCAFYLPVQIATQIPVLLSIDPKKFIFSCSSIHPTLCSGFLDFFLHYGLSRHCQQEEIGTFPVLDSTLKMTKQKKRGEPFQSNETSMGIFGIPLGGMDLPFNETWAREDAKASHAPQDSLPTRDK